MQLIINIILTVLEIVGNLNCSLTIDPIRHLEHSTIIYEDAQQQPLLRLCWNKQDPNYLATMATDGLEVR